MNENVRFGSLLGFPRVSSSSSLATLLYFSPARFPNERETSYSLQPEDLRFRRQPSSSPSPSPPARSPCSPPPPPIRSRSPTRSRTPTRARARRTWPAPRPLLLLPLRLRRDALSPSPRLWFRHRLVVVPGHRALQCAFFVHHLVEFHRSHASEFRERLGEGFRCASQRHLSLVHLRRHCLDFLGVHSSWRGTA